MQEKPRFLLHFFIQMYGVRQSVTGKVGLYHKTIRSRQTRDRLHCLHSADCRGLSSVHQKLASLDWHHGSAGPCIAVIDETAFCRCQSCIASDCPGITSRKLPELRMRSQENRGIRSPDFATLKNQTPRPCKGFGFFPQNNIYLP